MTSPQKIAIQFTILIGVLGRLAACFAEPPQSITNSIGMKLVLIPAGEFDMGSLEDPDEKPVHHVTISHSFYMGQCEVTLGEFLKFYHAAKYQLSDGEGQGWAKTTDPNHREHEDLVRSKEFVPCHWGHPDQSMQHPVVNVSMFDAEEFCKWLSTQEHGKYRLPTEAEWEYACRAGTKTRYGFGASDERFDEFGNCADKSFGAGEHWPSDKSINDGFPLTAPVGSFKPNAFGLYDMHGNVYEWTSDQFDKRYYHESPAIDPTGPHGGRLRVTLRADNYVSSSFQGEFKPRPMDPSVRRYSKQHSVRGGAFMLHPIWAYSASRGFASPYDGACWLGFRVVLESAEQKSD